MTSQFIWGVGLLPIALLVLSGSGDAVSAQEAATRGASGLPLPRFVSLKAQPVNMRKGPGRQYPTVWVMRRAGTPLEIVREFQGWREVRDADGARGWILGSLLSGRRTAIVQPWDRGKDGQPGLLVGLHRTRSTNGSLVAKLEAGTGVSVLNCNGEWCQVALEHFLGYVEQWRLWGVYKAEVIR